ncbi:MAG: hypothetical protein SFV51_26450 [Bryobacteraceae bacterium]|nr:hypothetical protein [Bryobacteraceae bacterium]
MFNLKSILSSRIVLNEDLSRILKNVFPSGQTGQSLGGVMDHLSQLLGGVAASNGAAAQVAQTLAGNGTGGGAAMPNLDSLGPALTKIAYIAVLAEAIEDAKGKQHFNVETAVNDLWVKLNRVRPQQNPVMKSGIADLMEQVAKLMKQQSTLMQQTMRQMR